MHGTTFISKHTYLGSFLWNLYTKPLKGSVVEPYGEVPYRIYRGSRYTSRIEPFKVLFRTFYHKSVAKYYKFKLCCKRWLFSMKQVDAT